MATRAIFLPGAAEWPNTSSGTPITSLRFVNGGRPAIAFNDSAFAQQYWTFIAPVGLVGPFSLVAYCSMASATSGVVVIDTAIEAITPGDASNIITSTFFGSANRGTPTVPATAGYLFAPAITQTNNQGLAPGDLVRVMIARSGNDASDTATGDLLVYAAELRDAA